MGASKADDRKSILGKLQRWAYCAAHVPIRCCSFATHAVFDPSPGILWRPMPRGIAESACIKTSH